MERYQFVKIPTADDVLKRDIKFAVGKFQDAQIQELGVYADGIIVTSASDTDILEAFVSDLFAWIMAEFGVMPVVGVTPETYFESTIIVKADADLTRAVTPTDDIALVLNRTFNANATTPKGRFVSSGFNLDCDASEFKGRRKPIHFAFERRLGVPFEHNMFFCSAPLRTKDHLAVLRTLETLALR
jgi:hypothetical protein